MNEQSLKFKTAVLMANLVGYSDESGTVRYEGIVNIPLEKREAVVTLIQEAIKSAYLDGYGDARDRVLNAAQDESELSVLIRDHFAKVLE